MKHDMNNVSIFQHQFFVMSNSHGGKLTKNGFCITHLHQRLKFSPRRSSIFSCSSSLFHHGLKECAIVGKEMEKAIFAAKVR